MMIARSLPLLLTAAGIILLAGCAPSHRLAEVELEHRSVAVMAAIPPSPRVVTGPWPFIGRPRAAHGELGRRMEAGRAAQARLDRAAERVDVAEILARRALTGSARALGFRPENDPEQADFVLDVRLLEFSFSAPSFDSAVRYFTESDIVLTRNDTGEVVWQHRLRERGIVDAAVFRAEFGRRLTARQMTHLTTDELANGIAAVAEMTAARMAQSLEAAYRAAHR
jgi:hypothetical protein